MAKNKFVKPQMPVVNQTLDLDFFMSYYDSIISLGKSMPVFWMDASNRDNNNDLADMGSARIAIYAGRYTIKNNRTGAGEHSWRINLPNGAFHVDKKNGRRDLTDPIILCTAENRQGKKGDPVALVVQDVDGDGFTVTVREVGGDSADRKKLNLDTINWVAIGIHGE